MPFTEHLHSLLNIGGVGNGDIGRYSEVAMRAVILPATVRRPCWRKDTMASEQITPADETIMPGVYIHDQAPPRDDVRRIGPWILLP